MPLSSSSSSSVVSADRSYASVAALPPRGSPNSSSPKSSAPESSGRRSNVSVSPLSKTRHHRDNSSDEEVRPRRKHPRRVLSSSDDDDNKIFPSTLYSKSVAPDVANEVNGSQSSTTLPIDRSPVLYIQLQRDVSPDPLELGFGVNPELSSSPGPSSQLDPSSPVTSRLCDNFFGSDSPSPPVPNLDTPFGGVDVADSSTETSLNYQDDRYQSDMDSSILTDEDDSDDNLSVNEDGISLGLFNDLLSEITDPVAYVKAALSGDFGGDRGKVTVSLSAAHPTVSLHQDVDSIGIYSDTIPVNQGKVVISITAVHVQRIKTKSHVGIRLPGEDHHTDVAGIPNYCFGKFGDLSRYNVSICFPSYTSSCGRKILSGVDVGYFIDYVILPTLHEVYKSQGLAPRDSILPFSQEQEWLSHRAGNGSMWGSFTIVPRNIWPLLLDGMRRRVHGLQDKYNMLFKDFFFFIYAHGVKESIDIFQAQENMTLMAKLEAVFSDVDWSLIDDSQVFVDLGFEFHVPHSVGLWMFARPLDRLPKISHARLLKKFVGPNLAQAQYQRYNFGGIKNVGGCRYLAPDIFEGVGQFKIHKLIAYHTMKEHFIKKGKNRIGDRAGINQVLSPSDVWENSRRYIGIIKTFSKTARLMGSTSFGARIEVRQRVCSANIYHRDLVNVARSLMNDTFLKFVPTRELLQLWVSRWTVARMVSENLRRQVQSRYSTDRFAAAFWAAHIINSLVQPISMAWYPVIIKRMIADVTSGPSDILFFPGAIESTSDGQFFSALEIDDQVLGKLYGKRGLQMLRETAPAYSLPQTVLFPTIPSITLQENVTTEHVNSSILVPSMPLPSINSSLELPEEIRLILSAVIDSGLTTTSATIFLTSWATEAWGLMNRSLKTRYLQDSYDRDLGVELFYSEDVLAMVLKPDSYTVQRSTGRLSKKMMRFVFYSIQEVQDAEDWQVLLRDDLRSPKKMWSGRAYLVLVATMLEAGRLDEMKYFEHLLIQQIDATIYILPVLEYGRIWRSSENKLMFIN
ncbi:hypothetical protein [Absidia glauca]|uniref:Uncharacterized protein n=1 Tax=Absidia glauca TaxID=4829 RepID=A0A168LI35_ABSGL|nr:hypothetical protein [Absidia glauca]